MSLKDQQSQACDSVSHLGHSDPDPLLCFQAWPDLADLPFKAAELDSEDALFQYQLPYGTQMTRGPAPKPVVDIWQSSESLDKAFPNSAISMADDGASGLTSTPRELEDKIKV